MDFSNSAVTLIIDKYAQDPVRLVNTRSTLKPGDGIRAGWPGSAG